MSLRVTARKNHLANRASPFIFQTASSDIVEFDRLVGLMASRTTLMKPDLFASMELLAEEVKEQLADGKTVKTPLGVCRREGRRGTVCRA